MRFEEDMLAKIAMKSMAPFVGSMMDFIFERRIKTPIMENPTPQPDGFFQQFATQTTK